MSCLRCTVYVIILKLIIILFLLKSIVHSKGLHIILTIEIKKGNRFAVHFHSFFHNTFIEGFLHPSPHLDSWITHSQTVEQLRSVYQNEKSAGMPLQIPWACTGTRWRLWPSGKFFVSVKYTVSWLSEDNCSYQPVFSTLVDNSGCYSICAMTM